MNRKDAIWLILLTAYISLGIRFVPFHGDESTTIWMSRDYGYIFMQHNLDAVRFYPPPLHTTEQHMRLITGSLTKYLMGLTWHIGGYEAEDINEQWDWGGDWDYNRNTGHAPDDTLLFLARLPSTIMLAIGTIIIFGIGLQIGGRKVAYVASLYYTLNPALLLNGRRAMFEGGLILYSLLTVLITIWFLQNKNWRSVIVLGMVSGLALSAKHTALLTLIPMFGFCFFYSLWYMKTKPQFSKQMFLKTITAGSIALTLFYIINPVWWGNPIVRAKQVVEARSDILEGQIAAFGGYENRIDQLSGFIRQSFFPTPQYYEVPAWENYISDQVSGYKKSLIQGVELRWIGYFIIIFACVGIWQIVKQARQTSSVVHWLFVIWVASIILGTAIITPLEWQRYYIMLYPPIGLLVGKGVEVILNGIIRYNRKNRL